jgi:tRNA ligase
LKKNGRVAKRPHVTIVHGKFAEKEHELWERCMSLHRLAVSPTFKFSLGSIIWNDRVMAATVENLAVDVPDDDTNAQEFVSTLPRHVQDRLHITIGTRNAQIPPVEAMAMVESLPTGNKVESVKLNGIVLHGRVKGLFS